MKVVGFHNQCPIVEFQYRYNLTHSCHASSVCPCMYILKLINLAATCRPPSFVRRGQMLSVRGEKVSEALFLDALKKAVSQWPGAQLVDYCCAESGIMGKMQPGAVCATTTDDD